MQPTATPLGTHHGARHDDTILLIGHGSRESEGNDEIHRFVAQWRARQPGWNIEVCFIEFAAPSLHDGLQQAGRNARRVLVLPLILIMWFPPYLIATQNMPLGKSLFFGVVGVLRNVGAFLVYFAGAALLGVGLPVLVIQLIGNDEGIASLLRIGVRMTLLFVLVPTLAASLYVSFQQVFAQLPEAVPEPDPDSGSSEDAADE